LASLPAPARARMIQNQRASHTNLLPDGQSARWPDGRPSLLPVIPRGIGDSGGAEAVAAQPAGVAVAARTAEIVCLVAGDRQRIIDAELHAAADDLRLREVDQRRG